MSKEWKHFATINDLSHSLSTKEIARKEKNFNNAIHNEKTLSVEKLKKHYEELYEKKLQEENNLLEAFKEKKLKSKTAIKKALILKKEKQQKEKEAPVE